MDSLRTRADRRRILEKSEEADIRVQEDGPEAFLAGEVRDDLLRMLFVCCDEAIPVESQLVLALKTLCGFSVPEIAHRSFSSEASTYKRLARARNRLRELSPRLGVLSGAQYATRLPAVHKVLYLLFTEGYLSSHAELAIRRELCNEALRLGAILAEHPAGQGPETSALLALMHLHAARIAARQDRTGGLLLLEEQDRKLWDQGEILVGLEWLAKSAEGDVLIPVSRGSGYCRRTLSRPFAWGDSLGDSDRVLLPAGTGSTLPLHRLNRAVAVAEWRGPAEGLADFESTKRRARRERL
jgi:predicted RNA polymerase sigma factor